ncbi:unnamed protein product, partial [Laminaria digitata]
MIKRRRVRMGRVGSRAAASFGTTHTRASTTTTTTSTTTTTAAAKGVTSTAAVAACHDRDHLASCRLCLSTRRVLSIARAHGKRHHHRHRDGSSGCGACGVWAKVMDRCASLGIVVVAANGSSSAWPGDGSSNGQLLPVG